MMQSATAPCTRLWLPVACGLQGTDTTAANRAIDKHVGSRVRMRRMMLAMSQQKLADGLGVSFQQVQKYEKGTNRIGAGRLQQISRILQVPVAFFFEGAPIRSALRGSMGRTARSR